MTLEDLLPGLTVYIGGLANLAFRQQPMVLRIDRVEAWLVDHQAPARWPRWVWLSGYELDDHGQDSAEQEVLVKVGGLLAVEPAELPLASC
jgi:hypothetical protein